MLQMYTIDTGNYFGSASSQFDTIDNNNKTASILAFMENESGNLFANTGDYLYMRFDGNWYRRITGQGWETIAAQPKEVTFYPMPEKQTNLFQITLKEQRLLS